MGGWLPWETSSIEFPAQEAARVLHKKSPSHVLPKQQYYCITQAAGEYSTAHQTGISTGYKSINTPDVWHKYTSISTGVKVASNRHRHISIANAVKYYKYCTKAPYSPRHRHISIANVHLRAQVRRPDGRKLSRRRRM